MHVCIGHNIKYIYCYGLQSKYFETHWINEKNFLVNRLSQHVFQTPKPFLYILGKFKKKSKQYSHRDPQLTNKYQKSVWILGT